MPADIILVILYIASFAALYSLFSTRIHKMLKNAGRRSKKETCIPREEKIVEEENRKIEKISKREERESEDRIPEPVIVQEREDETTRKIAAQLSQDELRVLKFLVEKGGECYQMEIYRTLGLPKSTVTKIVHRLSEKGLIAVERRGRYNYVRIIQKERVKKLVNVAELVA